MKKPAIVSLAITLTFLTLFDHSVSNQAFDVRKHLSTVSRYGVVKDITDNSFIPTDIPEGCSPIHLNLVARHGTRSPTKKRMRELDGLSAHLEILMKEAENQKSSIQSLPAWMRGWKSPWKGKLKGGELISKGEEELYDLGIRVRDSFPDLFNEDYHPDIYTIKATQVPRASASAVAFGMGLYSGRGSIGPGNHRAFAVTSESRASDIMLRFYDCCANYKDFRKKQEPSVDKLKEPVLDEITSALADRYGLNFTRQDIASLWFLCKQEASLLDVTDQACSLFKPSEVALLEWTDDLELYILKGYGQSLNYRMGVPLLEDVVQSMEQAIKAKEGNNENSVNMRFVEPCWWYQQSLFWFNLGGFISLLALFSLDEHHVPGSFEKARLRFAHAETVIPFSCLLGLFLEGSEFEQIQKEKPLALPPKPPQKRNWRGSIVAPFAGNNMLVLYSCPANSTSKYFVRTLHNEHPISLQGCGGSDFCPFEVFKERVIGPHLNHNYHAICNVKQQQESQKSETSYLSFLFRWLYSPGKGDQESHKDEF